MNIIAVNLLRWSHQESVIHIYGIYVTGSGKTDQLEQILVLSNSQIYRLQCIIS